MPQDVRELAAHQLDLGFGHADPGQPRDVTDFLAVQPLLGHLAPAGLLSILECGEV